MILLDLFCGAGGASIGYSLAGFQVVGIDIRPQPNYPFEFYQMDAIEFLGKHGRDFDIIHASPPCQAYSTLRHLVEAQCGPQCYPNLIAETRQALMRTGRPYIIENVPNAPLVSPLMLCGLMFGLKLFRHRMFETSFFLLAPPHPHHPPNATTNSHRGISGFKYGATHIGVYGNNFILEDAKMAMGIESAMTSREIAQAIPPAYTKWIGENFLRFYGDSK